MKLREHLRQQRLRQAELAAALSMTPSAVSQILSGRIVPNQQTFDRILEILSLSGEDREKLQSLLLGIRSEMYRMRSPLNRRIHMLRSRAGHSLAEAERLSGISTIRMIQLENISSAVPSESEREALTRLFGVELMPEDDNGGVLASPILEVSDHRSGFDEDGRGSHYILCMSPADFADFGADETLSDYIDAHPFDFVPADFSPKWNTPVLVQGSGEAFHLKMRGRVRIIVAEVGSVEKPAVVFCGDGRGNCFLRGSREAGFPFSSDRRFRAVWRLPVVDMSFRPAQKLAGNKECEE